MYESPPRLSSPPLPESRGLKGILTFSPLSLQKGVEGWNLIFTCLLSQGTETPPGQPFSNMSTPRSHLEGLSVPEPVLHQDFRCWCGDTLCSRRYTEGSLCTDGGVDGGKDRREEERGREGTESTGRFGLPHADLLIVLAERCLWLRICQHLELSCSSPFQRSDSEEAAHAGHTGFTLTAHEGAYFMS